ncbi:ATP-binding cassette domain-containing protein [Sinomonas susongensis]|uniref:ATP-binding cassette domain-containing protein n=1 Tax=Sinomonas susongensis TaxID=1324851 RepID=UPI0011090A86|nr:ABC transporter ATP-binding protein [Sinomonas susongensis]
MAGVTFMVEAGEVVGLVGPNGSGKTTLVHLIFNLIEGKGGSILVNGQDHRAEGVRTEMIYLPSDNVLPEFLTGLEYLQVLAGLYREPGCADEIRIREQFVRFGMAGRAGDLIEDYSHGMQKKLLLISAFLLRRRLTVIDETLNGIDLDALDACKEEFLNMAARGQSVLVCTHDLGLLEEIAHRVLVLRGGRLVADLEVPSVVGNGSQLKLVVRSTLSEAEPP